MMKVGHENGGSELEILLSYALSGVSIMVLVPDKTTIR